MTSGGGKIRFEDLGPVVQDLLKTLKREVSEDDIELLSTITVKEMAQIYNMLGQGNTPEQVMTWLLQKAKTRVDVKLKPRQDVVEQSLNDRNEVETEEAEARAALQSRYREQIATVVNEHERIFSDEEIVRLGIKRQERREYAIWYKEYSAFLDKIHAAEDGLQFCDADQTRQRTDTMYEERKAWGQIDAEWWELTTSLDFLRTLAKHNNGRAMTWKHWIALATKADELLEEEDMVDMEDEGPTLGAKTDLSSDYDVGELDDDPKRNHKLTGVAREVIDACERTILTNDCPQRQRSQAYAIMSRYARCIMGATNNQQLLDLEHSVTWTPLPPDWRGVKDRKGRLYYLNTTTAMQQWNRPAAPAPAGAKTHTAADCLAHALNHQDNLERHQDNASQWLQLSEGFQMSEEERQNVIFVTTWGQHVGRASTDPETGQVFSVKQCLLNSIKCSTKEHMPWNAMYQLSRLMKSSYEYVYVNDEINEQYVKMTSWQLLEYILANAPPTWSEWADIWKELGDKLPDYGYANLITYRVSLLDCYKKAASLDNKYCIHLAYFLDEDEVIMLNGKRRGYLQFLLLAATSDTTDDWEIWSRLWVYLSSKPPLRAAKMKVMLPPPNEDTVVTADNCLSHGSNELFASHWFSTDAKTAGKNYQARVKMYQEVKVKIRNGLMVEENRIWQKDLDPIGQKLHEMARQQYHDRCMMYKEWEKGRRQIVHSQQPMSWQENVLGTYRRVTGVYNAKVRAEFVPEFEALTHQAVNHLQVVQLLHIEEVELYHDELSERLRRYNVNCKTVVRDLGPVLKNLNKMNQDHIDQRAAVEDEEPNERLYRYNVNCKEVVRDLGPVLKRLNKMNQDHIDQRAAVEDNAELGNMEVQELEYMGWEENILGYYREVAKVYNQKIVDKFRPLLADVEKEEEIARRRAQMTFKLSSHSTEHIKSEMQESKRKVMVFEVEQGHQKRYDHSRHPFKLVYKTMTITPLSRENFPKALVYLLEHDDQKRWSLAYDLEKREVAYKHNPSGLLYADPLKVLGLTPELDFAPCLDPAQKQHPADYLLEQDAWMAVAEDGEAESTRMVYFNAVSNDSTYDLQGEWARPATAKPVMADLALKRIEEKKAMRPKKQHVDPNATQKKKPAGPKTVYLKVWSDEYSCYYFQNLKTSETTWDEPAAEGASVYSAVTQEGVEEPFYLNDRTESRYWDLPTGGSTRENTVEAAGAGDLLSPSESMVLSGGRTESMRTFTKGEEPACPKVFGPPDVFVELVTEDGDPYYMNFKTGETMWERPTEWSAHGDPSGEAPEDQMGLTKQHSVRLFKKVDEGEDAYYWNEKTGKTTWDLEDESKK